MRRVACLASAVFGVCLLVLHAQTPAPQQPVDIFRAGVDVVQMDVSVLDKDRRAVKGLTAADFTILEDGKPQSIVEFDAVDIPDSDMAAAPWTRDAAVDVATNDRLSRRVVLIVLDDMFIPLDRTKEVWHIARDVVARLGPEDLAAVTYTGQGRRQDITTDRSRLLKAIDDFVPHIQQGGNLQCAYRGKFRSEASCAFDTLVTASQALLDAPQGRKTLVYISGGFNYTTDIRSLGMGPLSAQTAVVEAENVLAIKETLNNLQRANVNVYAIDPSGVTQEGVMGPAKDWLRMFSEDTGGRATMNTNTPWEAVPQIFRENSSYYVLGFRSTNPIPDGAFRKVQVKVNRRDVEVRARSGYTAPGGPVAATAAGLAATPLEKAIRNSMPSGDLALRTTLAPFAVPGQKNAALAVATLLRDPLAAGAHTIEVTTLALDGDCGECRKLPSRKQIVTFSPRAGQTAHAEILSRLELPPGNYEIRVAATLGERAGSVIAHVDVPDFRKAKLAASGLVLSASSGVVTAERAVMADLFPILPTAMREFTRAMPVGAFLRLYQAGAKTTVTAQVTTTILDASGKTDIEDKQTIDSGAFAKTRSADYRWDVPVAKFDAGPHLLTINVQVGNLSITREARFSVK